MLDSTPFRWLGILLLVFSLPAASQSALPSSSTTGASSLDSEVASAEQQSAYPRNEEAGDALMRAHRYQAAIESFQKLASPSARVWNKMGVAYQVMHAHKDALRCYRESLRLRPDDARTLNNMATLQDQMKDLAGAERNYRKSIEQDSSYALTFKNLGTNLLMQHRYEEGAAAYRQALVLDPHIFDQYDGPTITASASPADRSTTSYFKARGCARAGLNDCALKYLRKAMNQGMSVKQVSEEEDFAPLRNTAGYAELMARQQE